MRKRKKFKPPRKLSNFSQLPKIDSENSKKPQPLIKIKKPKKKKIKKKKKFILPFKAPLTINTSFQNEKVKKEKYIKKYWECNYAKRSNKKHKNWESGYLTYQKQQIELFDIQGTSIQKQTKSMNLQLTQNGSVIYCGNKEIELLDEIDEDDFLYGDLFEEKDDDDEKDDDEEEVSGYSYWECGYCKKTRKKKKNWNDGFMKYYKKKNTIELFDNQGKFIVKNSTFFSKISDSSSSGGGKKKNKIMNIGKWQVELYNEINGDEFENGNVFKKDDEDDGDGDVKMKKKVKKFKIPLSTKNLPIVNRVVKDTKAPVGSYILNEGHSEYSKRNKLIYDVYLDKLLFKKLRKHQIDGIQFLYNTVYNGFVVEGGDRKYNGCLLADEMGMGKTIQVVSLAYTLIKRGKYGKPAMKKVIIVTNSSLCRFWKKEFKDWLGDTRITPLVCTSKSHDKSPVDTIHDFNFGYYKVLIISYSLCSLYIDEILKVSCDLLICDEGHKLKNRGIKVFRNLSKIETNKKIILTGTPIQNNLDEFYSVVDFINPGILGDEKHFKTFYSSVIFKSRDFGASNYEKSLGNKRSKELNDVISKFFIRRTMKLIQKDLPTKNVFVIFIKMSKLQEKLYVNLIESSLVSNILSKREYGNALACIQNLKKLLTHPVMVHNLLNNEDNKMWDEDSVSLFPEDFNEHELNISYSTKLFLLSNIVDEVKLNKEKIVIVSNFTKILDVIEIMLNDKRVKFLRLDGSTPSNKRMELVDTFNDSKSNAIVFLLSSRAGGQGLNLTGANRLVVFDPDWNPAYDHQAMARIWRISKTSESKNCNIYRFIQTGTIEEKIYQRQLVKTNLSKTVIDKKFVKTKFSKSMLKELFNYDPNSICETYKDEIDQNFLDNIQKVDNSLFNSVQKMKNSVSFIKLLKDEDAEIKFFDGVEIKDSEPTFVDDDDEEEEVDDDDDEYIFEDDKKNNDNTMKDDDDDDDEEEEEIFIPEKTKNNQKSSYKSGKFICEEYDDDDEDEDEIFDEKEDEDDEEEESEEEEEKVKEPPLKKRKISK